MSVKISKKYNIEEKRKWFKERNKSMKEWKNLDVSGVGGQ